MTLASGVSTGTGTSGINFNVYGAGSSGSTANSATTAMTILGSGNVGIGTTNPTAGALQVQGTIWANSGNVVASSGNVYSNGGAVGWYNGTYMTSPAVSVIHLGQADAAAPVAYTLGVQNVASGTSNTAGANFTINGSQGTGTGAGGGLIFQTAPASGSSGSSKNALATAMEITGAGDVGIGTTTPTNILSLVGSASQTFWMERNPTANTAGNSLTVEASGATSGATNKNGGNLTLSSGISTGTGTSNIQFNVFPGTAGSTSDNPATTAMTIVGGTGSVGIGTTSTATGIEAAINGVVQVAGTGSESCSASTVGVMRYNPTGNYMEICSYP